MNWLNFRHLYAFWMVWKCGGFRKAAEKIRVAQSALSDQVSQLESYLGKPLFIRSPRKIELTGTGRILVDYAEKIFFQAEEINHVIRDESTSFFPESLNIGIVGGISRNFVSHFVSSVQETHPETYCSIITGSATELFAKLDNHDLHLVFSLEFPDKKEAAKFAYRKVLSSPLCLAGEKSLMDHLEKKTLEREVPFYEFMFNYPAEVLKVLKKKLAFSPKVSTRSDDIPLLRFLANSTKGIALLPQVGVKDDQEKEQIQTLVISELGTVDICGYFSKSGPYRKIAETVFESYTNS